jgi:hypothetical protein
MAAKNAAAGVIEKSASTSATRRGQTLWSTRRTYARTATKRQKTAIGFQTR